MKPIPLLLILAVVVPLAGQRNTTMFPAVRGTREMVAAANNFEVEAGVRLLMQGGNAVDAGVAAVFAATVTELSRVGLGGEMPLIINMAGKKPTVISGVGTAPEKATVDYYRNRQPEPWENTNNMPPIPENGIRAAIVPGLFDGLLLALRKHGTKSFAEVIAPAIEYADGYPIGEEVVSFITFNQKLLASWPASAAFFMPGGGPPPRGEIFRMPALANTLRELVQAEKKQRGRRDRKLQAVRDAFYKGDLARRIGAFSEANGGLITYKDLAGFSAGEEEPVCAPYREYVVCKPGFWTQGPVMLQALQILEGYDLKSMGHNSPEYLHTFVEAVKLAFADRDRYYGDPKFSKIPSEILLSKDYAADRRKLIDPNHASMDSRPGTFAPPLPPPSASTVRSQANDTTCVNVVDRWGNVFSATPSGAWLPSVIAGDTGVPFTTRLQSFVLTDGHANQLAPGKRPRVTLSPTLVLKDGKPYMALSTPGGDNQDQALLQVMLNIIEFHMSPQEAAEAPRFQTEHFYASFANHEFVPGKLNLEARIRRETAEALMMKGHRVQITGDWSNSSAPTVIRIEKGVLDGAADPRRNRYIFGR